MLRLRMCAFARRIKCWSTLTAAAAGLATTAVHAEYSFDSSFLEIGGGNASSEVAEQVKAMSQGQLPGIYRVDLSVDDRRGAARPALCARNRKPGLDPQWSVPLLQPSGPDGFGG